MTDEQCIKLLDPMLGVLSEMEFHEDCRHLLPSYNALLNVAQKNHPEDPFINVLPPITDGHANSNVLKLLLTQLKIALEGQIPSGASEASPNSNEAPPGFVGYVVDQS
jgi:hypothetical protein